jgi:hypothetical protein
MKNNQENEKKKKDTNLELQSLSLNHQETRKQNIID